MVQTKHYIMNAIIVYFVSETERDTFLRVGLDSHVKTLRIPRNENVTKVSHLHWSETALHIDMVVLYRLSARIGHIASTGRAALNPLQSPHRHHQNANT